MIHLRTLTLSLLIFASCFSAVSNATVNAWSGRLRSNHQRLTANATTEFLVKLQPGAFNYMSLLNNEDHNDKKMRLKVLTSEWVLVTVPAASSANQLALLQENPDVQMIQPNYSLHLLENYRIEDPLRRSAVAALLQRAAPLRNPVPRQDNPNFIPTPKPQTGMDPNLKNQWGLMDNGVEKAWEITRGQPSMIVAVIDTGVDYTHEDLVGNLWKNPGETGVDANGKDKSSNGVDDDGNGYIDDVIGWDFAGHDNKPYDLSIEPMEIIVKGGNPGHGTHCAGTIAASGMNQIGISGIAPETKIMSLRFISEKGSGTTADAILAIKYAVDNGAKVLSNSWGSEGDDPDDPAGNQALKDIITYAQDHGVLFIAAAGNGHNGVGYDNDSDARPSVPASYTNDNIISVAAIDSHDKLGSFSNWGLKSVDIAAPGLRVFSTMTASNYGDLILDVAGFEIPWDGTSMAAPHVAGAAALYWSAHPEKTWEQVKAAILNSAKPVPAYKNKLLTGGKLNIENLLLK